MGDPLKRLKRAKFPQAAISAPRVLNANSPILTQDLHAFLTTALAPSVWSEYTEAEKRNLIDLLPAAYRNYNVNGADGRLECPVSIAFLQSDAYVRAGVARFKRDVEAGCWEARWQEQARKARAERQEGEFDEFLKDRAEEWFGEDDGGDAAEGEDEEGQSGSDWERDREGGLNQKQKQKQKQKQIQKEREVGEEFIVEKLLRQNVDGSRIEVKWRGYEETTWESRRVLLEDVPDMMNVLEAQMRGDVEMDTNVEEALKGA